MSLSSTNDPVSYWQSAAEAYKHKAKTLCKDGSAAQRYHENEAMECERKAAVAAAAHAFPTK